MNVCYSPVILSVNLCSMEFLSVPFWPTYHLTCSLFVGQPLAPSAPPPVTTAAGTIINATASATVSGGRHVTTPPANVPVNTISGESCLATGKGLLYTAYDKVCPVKLGLVGPIPKLAGE